MQVANDTIIMLIGLVYCVIQPIIAPLALIYFGIGVLIWKYQVVYVYVPLVESGGKVRLHRHGNSLSCVYLLLTAGTLLEAMIDCTVRVVQLNHVTWAAAQSSSGWVLKCDSVRLLTVCSTCTTCTHWYWFSSAVIVDKKCIVLGQRVPPVNVTITAIARRKWV